MLYIVTGKKNSGKTSMLERINKTSKGYGVISKKMYYENQMVGYYLLNINTGEGSIHIIEKTRFFETDNMGDYEENDRFCFINSSFSKGIKWIRDSFKTADSIFIDEIGELEFVKKKGFESVLKRLIKISEDRDVYMGVRDENLKYIKAMKEKMGFEYALLKPIVLTAIILAAGDSKRFSHGNKLLMKIGDKTIIEKTIDQVLKVGFFNHVVVVYNDDEIKKIIDKYDNVEALYNDKAEQGISESVKCGVKWAQNFNSDGYMFVPADQVGITAKILRRIADKFFENPNEIVQPIFIDKSGSPLVFPQNYASELLELEGDAGGKSIINKNDHQAVETYFETKEGLYDIDTVEDYHNYILDKYMKTKIKKRRGKLCG